MTSRSSEINELFASAAEGSEEYVTTYQFRQQGIKVRTVLPETLIIRFLQRKGQLDNDPRVVERQLDYATNDNVGFDDILAKREDKVRCERCFSPEARWTGTKIFTRWNHKTEESEEVGEALTALCNDCTTPPSSTVTTDDPIKQRQCAALDIKWVENRYTPIPRIGSLLPYVVRPSTERLRSQGYYRNPGTTRKFTRSKARVAVEAKPEAKVPVAFRYTHDYMKMADDKYRAGLMTFEQYEFIMADLRPYLSGEYYF